MGKIILTSVFIYGETVNPNVYGFFDCPGKTMSISVYYAEVVHGGLVAIYGEGSLRTSYSTKVTLYTDIDVTGFTLMRSTLESLLENLRNDTRNTLRNPPHAWPPNHHGQLQHRKAGRGLAWPG